MLTVASVARCVQLSQSLNVRIVPYSRSTLFYEERFSTSIECGKGMKRAERVENILHHVSPRNLSCRRNRTVVLFDTRRVVVKLLNSSRPPDDPDYVPNLCAVLQSEWSPVSS